MSFSGTVPADFSIGNQTDADCFGWQEFIALNWPASGSNFGTPGDLSELQWQGYMNTHQLFQPNGAAPPPWGTRPQISAECQAEAGLSAEKARTVLPLVNATKFSDEFLSTGDNAEAFPGDAPAWLGDVNGNNVWFEIRVNQDEYNFIVNNQFYNADKQLAFYTSQPQPPTIPLQLPSGCNGPSSACPQTQVGAIELKAAWMKVPNPTDSKWNSYKLSAAVVVDPKTQKCEFVTVALVAFHIIHKTQSQSTWVWATFEHKNNAPNSGTTSTQVWNFNNPNFTPATVNVGNKDCQYNNQASVTTTSTPNQSPQYYLGDGCPASTPTQVTRMSAIDPTASSVNTTVQTAIQNAFSGSVWQNYMLVNVVWSTNPPTVPPANNCKPGFPGCQGVRVPQITQSLNPNSAVANTVLETYIQVNDPKNPLAKSNCILCHQYATIPNAPSGTAYASDFSFALGSASSPPSTATPKAGLKSKILKKKKIRNIFR